MSPVIDFFVHGIPKAAGSKRAFAVKKGGVYTGRTVVIDANPNSRDWKTDVSIAARAAYQGELLRVPLSLTLRFYFPRPKDHYGSGKNSANIKDSAPLYPAGKPDVTKLIRGVEDALTGILWVDDARIVTQFAIKRYGNPNGVRIEVNEA